MSLLKTIRDETLKLDCDVAGLLRMCKVLAVTLESPELENVCISPLIEPLER